MTSSGAGKFPRRRRGTRQDQKASPRGGGGVYGQPPPPATKPEREAAEIEEGGGQSGQQGCKNIPARESWRGSTKRAAPLPPQCGAPIRWELRLGCGAADQGGEKMTSPLKPPLATAPNLHMARLCLPCCPQCKGPPLAHFTWQQSTSRLTVLRETAGWRR